MQAVPLAVARIKTAAVLCMAEAIRNKPRPWARLLPRTHVPNAETPMCSPKTSTIWSGMGNVTLDAANP